MYEIERLPQSIDIGFTGEMDFRTVQIDMSEWVAKMPEGQPTLMHIRPGEYDPYPVTITYENNIITWSVTDGDLGTSEGTGLLQVWFGVQDETEVMRQLGMSAVVPTIIHLSLAGEGRNSSTVQIPWLKEVMELKNIILGYDYEAESWANGQRGGEDVGSDDPAYHNNAKYYKEQVEDMASDAEAFAAGTRGGEAVDEDDPAYHNNASYYNDQAALEAATAAAAAATASAAYNVNLLAPNYTDLTFPVKKGQPCIYSGGYYEALVDIATTEEWTSAHWKNTKVGAEVNNLKSAFDSVAIKDNAFATTWEIGGLNGSGAGVTASNRVRNKPAFTVRPMQRIEADSSVEIRIAYYNTTNSTFDHWNSEGYETGIFHLEYGYKARIVARYAADPTSDIASATPFYSLVKIITSTYKNIPEVDDTLAVSGAAADAKKTGDEINQLYGLSIVQTEIPVEYVSGGLNGTTWAVTSDNTRIRLKGTATPKMKTGDTVVIDPLYEARVIASINPGYGKSVVGVVTGENWVSGVVTIPEQYNGKYIGVLIRKVGHLSDDISADVSSMSDYVKLYSIETTAQNTERNTLSGLTFSILGDSISALKDYIPAGNEHYYSGSNHGVTSVNQMWWKVLADSTGAIPLIMNAWSGSAVTQLEDSSHISKVPMSDNSRCYALHAYVQVNQGDTGAIEVTSENIADIVTSPFYPDYTPTVGDYVKKIDPDIVIIAGGVNDYTYAESAQSEALPWNGKTTPVISASFTEAYACMIKKIQYAYPSAIIVALSTWFTMRGDDNGYTLTHTVGSNVYTQTDYNDAIRAVAEQMHIPYMDVSNIGFNRNNFYPTYASDSSTIPTHPNANGQFVMGRAITRRIVPLVKGFKDQ